ncbi:MAG: hypothetical protein HC794_05480 [Nitrospiraceae bacterium]|nr:hypothetical protein [Nitrospiraceae bacterium]
MRRLEHQRILHPDGRQFIDVEKPAIVDLFRRHPPIRQSVGLVVQHGIQQIEASRIALPAIDQADVLIQKPPDHRAAVDQRGQAALDDFLLSIPFGDQLGRAILSRRQMLQPRDDALELHHLGTPRARLLDQIRQSMRQNQHGRLRRHGQLWS